MIVWIAMAVITNIALTTFLIVRLSKLSRQVVQHVAKVDADSDEPAASEDGRDANQYQRDLRRAAHLARRYVRAMIDWQTRRMRVAFGVSTEPDEDNEQMRRLESQWTRELGPRIEEVIDVGCLPASLPRLLYSEGEKLLNERLYHPLPPPMPRSYDEARALFDEEIEQVRNGKMDPFGRPAYSEAVDLAYWAVIEHLKKNVESSADFQSSDAWDSPNLEDWSRFAEFEVRVREVQGKL